MNKPSLRERLAQFLINGTSGSALKVADRILSIMAEELEEMLDESTVDGTTDYELFAEKVISLMNEAERVSNQWSNEPNGQGVINLNNTSSSATKLPKAKTTSTVKGKFKYKIGGEK